LRLPVQPQAEADRQVQLNAVAKCMQGELHLVFITVKIVSIHTNLEPFVGLGVVEREKHGPGFKTLQTLLASCLQ